MGEGEKRDDFRGCDTLVYACPQSVLLTLQDLGPGINLWREDMGHARVDRVAIDVAIFLSR